MVQMQKEATWGWEKIKLATSDVQWENSCQVQDASGQLWKGLGLGLGYIVLLAGRERSQRVFVIGLGSPW